ncbi:MAG: P-loop NTPase fold protein [Bdellovibrionales bacterium]
MSQLIKSAQCECVDKAWSGDRLQAKRIADYLTPVIGSIKQPFVISLNAPYGTGKTFFIKNWKKDLEDQGYKAVYFNAWETDYTGDVLVSFAGCIDEQLRDTVSKTASLVAHAGKVVATKLLPTVVKGLVRKGLGDEAMRAIEAASSIKPEDIDSTTSAIADGIVHRHNAITKSVQEFKTKLQELVTHLPSKNGGDRKTKLIIFVDELDRCRPTYAIEVLECIKHLFCVAGVVFVLAADIAQLKATVSKIYGANVNSEGYLRKFIDWQLNLPKLSRRQFCEALYKEFQLEDTGKFTSNETVHTDYKYMIDAITMVAERYDLSLRTIAQVFTDINLCVRSLKFGEHPHPFPLGLVAALRHTQHTAKEINQICSGKASCDQIVEGFRFDFESLKPFDRIRFKEEAEILVRATFMSREQYLNISKERNILTTDISSAKNVGREPSKENISRHKHLTSVIEYYDAFHQGKQLDPPQEPIAQRVLDRLDNIPLLLVDAS